MPRQHIGPWSPVAHRSTPDGGAPSALRPSAAPTTRGRVARLLVAPFAAVLAALAGLLYLVLLPICGIASIAGAVAQSSWALLREACGGARRRTAPRT